MTARPAPPPPPAARTVFGAALPTAQSYAGRLADAGIERGLIGPGELDRLWERHLLNSAALAPLLPGDARVADIGSGAGLPGIVLAILREDVAIRLLEPQARRVDFLVEVVDDLGLGNVEVVRARAEDPAARRLDGYDCVVARAVAPLDRLVVLSAPLLRPGGALLALKGVRATTEAAAATVALRKVRGRAEVLERSLPDGGGTATVVRVVVGGPDRGPDDGRPTSSGSRARHR